MFGEKNAEPMDGWEPKKKQNDNFRENLRLYNERMKKLKAGEPVD